ncbi:MAG: biotin--[acetyl-CoA-carboxylase] ligase [Cyanobacteria bacterium SW_9_44_58]|nr:MAG: biotin--[acetyl-CoA-carboxylase] ligase [Cyanobacteria bacterium SW_9_44_58]
MIKSYSWQNKSLPVYYFPELASTNYTAWQLFQKGNVTPFIVTADQQTAGKGQWGRQWVSSQGGLYLSIVLSPNITIEQPSHLTISTVFGITEMLSAYQIPVQIKWLNDIFLKRRKLGGVLTETRVKTNQLKAVVIGIGINWNNKVPAMGIALKNYLSNNNNINAELDLNFTLKEKINSKQLPAKIINLNDLKQIVITGTLFGCQRCFEEGLTAILPQYEARLLNEFDK